MHQTNQIKPLDSNSVYTPEQQNITLMLISKMRALGYKGTFSHIASGPVITQYFFNSDPFAPLAKIMSRAEDMALAAQVESVLISREKDKICISVPNKKREIISFDKALNFLATERSSHSMVTSSPEIDVTDFIPTTDYMASIPILMGQTPTGEYFSIDLAAQPHMLIAGSTGAGKSVFISQVILALSILKDPADLRMLLVDTKGVDFPLFTPLPHVITCVSDIKELHLHLDKILALVRTRLATMQGVARNINELRTITGQKYPTFVVIIDEFADIIGLDQELAKEETKDDKRTRIAAKLCQIAQISRAAGIHIIAATQRPSVKIINGDIKTNFSGRISFKMPSGTDSRTILDAAGAEFLLGKGDFLYRTSGDATPKRGHGAYVSLGDIGRIIEQNEEIREYYRSFYADRVN